MKTSFLLAKTQLRSKSDSTFVVSRTTKSPRRRFQDSYKTESFPRNSFFFFFFNKLRIPFWPIYYVESLRAGNSEEKQNVQVTCIHVSTQITHTCGKLETGVIARRSVVPVNKHESYTARKLVGEKLILSFVGIQSYQLAHARAMESYVVKDFLVTTQCIAKEFLASCLVIII